MSKRLARCEECKRRKRLCKGSGKACEYCTKKGVECVFNSFHIIEFSPNKRPKKLESREPLKKTKLLAFFKKLITERDHQRVSNCCAHLTFMISSSFHLPLIQSSHITENSSDVVVITDQNVKRLFNDAFTLTSNNISEQLMNLALSCTRVDYINLSEDKTPLGLGSIKEFLSIIKDPTTVSLIKNHFNVIEDTDSTLSNIVPVSESVNNEAIKSRKFTSLDDVDLVVDVDQIKNSSGVEECGIDFDNEMPSPYPYIPRDIGLEESFVNYLFREFCDKEKDLNYYLNVCLPVLVGSSITMNSCVVLSFYKLKNKQNFTQKEHKMIDELYLHCLQELQHRLYDFSSITCDHTMMTIMLLLNVELIRGARGRLWGQLITLTRYSTTFKGGSQEFASNLTGLCMMKLFASQLCLAFFPLVAEDPIDQSTLADFFFIIDSQPDLNFYDNVNYFNGFTLVEMKDIVKTIGHISYLESLAKVCYSGNNLSISATVDVPDYHPRFGSYQYINEQNLNYVLTEAMALETNIKNLLLEYEGDDSNSALPVYYQTQLKFGLRSSLLYISQIIYKQTSKTPKTMLTVRALCLEVEDLLNELMRIDYKSGDITIFVLPFLLLGVDLTGVTDRAWLRSRLMELYLSSRKEGIYTCVLLLDKVWDLNRDGNTYVDWREISKEEYLRVCLLC